MYCCLYHNVVRMPYVINFGIVLFTFYRVTMPSLGLPELLIIALILVLLFGAKKIPDLMKGLGSGIKEFKKASTLDEDEGKENSAQKP